MGTLNKTEKSKNNNKEEPKMYFGKFENEGEKQKLRNHFINKVHQLFKKLESYLDVDRCADESSLDFIVNRLPPIQPDLIPPHPPRSLLQENDEDEDDIEPLEISDKPVVLSNKKKVFFFFLFLFYF